MFYNLGQGQENIHTKGQLMISTVLAAKSYSDVMFCLQSYQGHMIDRSFLFV